MSCHPDYEPGSQEETEAALSDRDTVRQLADSEAELARGDGESEEQLSEAMRRRQPQA